MWVPGASRGLHWVSQPLESSPMAGKSPLTTPALLVVNCVKYLFNLINSLKTKDQESLKLPLERWLDLIRVLLNRIIVC